MNENKWRYGDSWEKYSINEGDTWVNASSGSSVTVHDIRDPLPHHMRCADMLYTDPPWNQGNVNSFISKAGSVRRVSSFAEFLDALFLTIDAIAPRVCYLEAGQRHVNDVLTRLTDRWENVTSWKIRYYRRHPCYLLRGGESTPLYDYSGLDDTETPLAAIMYEKPNIVADCCTGRGLTLLAAHKCGIQFHGTELNKRRLAVALELSDRAGCPYLPITCDTTKPAQPAGFLHRSVP